MKDGACEGKGKLTYTDGSTYVGDFKNSEFDGKGTFTGDMPMITDGGTKYVGEWKDGHMHGRGTLTYSNGKTQSGFWKNSKFDGW